MDNKKECSDDCKIVSEMSDSCCTIKKEKALLSGIGSSIDLNAIVLSDSYGSSNSMMPYVHTVREKNYAK